jgi:ATP-dependent RNA helicase DDX60
MKRQKKDEDEIPDDGESISWQTSFDPDDVLPQFSFAGITRDYSREELEKDIMELRLRAHLAPWIVQALRRGIAVHHAGMNKSYRGLIERYGYLILYETYYI